ncbi:hypothetical protein MMC18_009124 [Xylographa bjoerkii]|nr:hypothetical protein [Xylographa bjoerkii]
MIYNSSSPVPSILLGALVLAAVYNLISYITTSRSRRKIIKPNDCKPPPKYPLRDPFFGIDGIRDALRAAKAKTFLEEKRGHYQQYGNTFSSRLSTLSIISTIEPENIKAVLSTKFEDFEVGSPRKNAFSPLLGNGIILCDGQQWERSRAFLRPSFSRSQVGDLATLEVHVQNLVKAIPYDGTAVDVAELFLRYTADVTTDFMFGESIQSLSQPESFHADLMAAFRDAQLGGEWRFRLGRFARFVPQPKFYTAVRLIHTYMDAHVDRALKYRQLQHGSVDDDSKTDGRYIFLHELSKVTNDRRTLRDELLTIFFAGRDTTSALLSNLFFVLARNDHIWTRLTAEVDELHGKQPTLEGLKAMKYLGFCLNEGQRVLLFISE